MNQVSVGNNLVTLFEILLFRVLVVSQAHAAVYGTLSKNEKRGGLYDNPKLATIKALICTMQRYERDSLHQHNSHLMLVSFMIAALPLILMVILVLSSSELRYTSFKYVYLDVMMAVLLLVSFQGLFYVLGRRWQYSPLSEIQHRIVEQYVADAAKDGDVDIKKDVNVLAALGPHKL